MTNEQTKSVAAFIDTLGPALARRGSEYANDVTLTKTMRTELAAAVKAGVFPKGTKFSVRINHHASITVQINTWEGKVFCDDYAAHVLDPKGTEWNPESYRHMATARRAYFQAELTEELNAAVAAMCTIVDRHNYDNSDSMTDYFDVGYYLTCDARPVQSAAMQGLKLESNPEFAALAERAKAAAIIVGAKYTKATLPRGGWANAGEWCLEQIVKAADKYGCELAYDKRSGWRPLLKSVA